MIDVMSQLVRRRKPLAGGRMPCIHHNPICSVCFSLNKARNVIIEIFAIKLQTYLIDDGFDRHGPTVPVLSNNFHRVGFHHAFFPISSAAARSSPFPIVASRIISTWLRQIPAAFSLSHSLIYASAHFFASSLASLSAVTMTILPHASAARTAITARSIDPHVNAVESDANPLAIASQFGSGGGAACGTGAAHTFVAASTTRVHASKVIDCACCAVGKPPPT